jgi:hypothetical protein
VKKILGILVVLLTLAAIVGCASSPATHPAPAPMVKAYPPQTIEHKGTAYGRDMPKWMDAAIDGPKAIEKLPDYANKYVVVVEATGQDLDGTQLAASKINAQTAISGLISTRVKDTFAGSQVGDKDKIENYMERVVKSVSEATFSGFAKETDWWVKQQTFTSDGKPDKQVYRVTQLWTIDKDVLKKQLTNQMSGAAAAEPKTEDKQKAIDLVQQSFFDGF